MDFDQALATILAFEALWAERRGRVRLQDAGIGRYLLVRVRGQFTSPPERWRRYPRGRAATRRRVIEH